MKSRERLLNIAMGRPVDRVPFFDWLGAWPETFERWKTEGMCENPFGVFDAGYINLSDGQGFRQGLFPYFDYELIGETENTFISRNIFGATQQSMKNGNTIPHFIDWPVKSRSDWNNLCETRFHWSEERMPKVKDLKLFADKINNGEQLPYMGAHPYGIFGTVRELVGVENFMVMLYDESDLIYDMMESMTTLWLKLFERIVPYFDILGLHMWEDMSGTFGSLISPDMFRQFMMPQYKRISAFCKSRGIELFSVDTDGDISQLVPLFMESGVNVIMPFECVGKMTVADYISEYPELCIMGGVNKRCFEEDVNDKDTMDKELKRIEKTLELGGRYVPHMDHAVHPTVSYKNFLYYTECMKDIIFS